MGKLKSSVLHSNMLANSAYRSYHFSSVEAEGDEIVYRLKATEGDGMGEMRCLCVIPGIYLSYDRMDMKSCYQKITPAAGFLAVSYCIGGCFEFELEGGQLCFMGEDDICVVSHENCESVSSNLPQNYYRGISIFIEIKTAQQSIDRLFPDAGLDLADLECIFRKKGITLVRARTEYKRIFTEINENGGRYGKTYGLIKTMEFLLLLHLLLEEPQELLPRFTPDTVRQTKKAYLFLMEDLSHRYSCREIAARFYLAETSLRACFKEVYGQPMKAFLRAQTIHHAAALVKSHPELSIGQIGQLCGYDNQSKFTAAFKKLMEETPLSYRNRLKSPDGEMD